MSSDSDESETAVGTNDPTSSEPEQSDSFSDDSTDAPETPSRKRRRLRRYNNYVGGTARGVYQLRSKDLQTASVALSPTIEGVCSACASGLSGVASGFRKLKHQGTELKKKNDDT